MLITFGVLVGGITLTGTLKQLNGITLDSFEALADYEKFNAFVLLDTGLDTWKIKLSSIDVIGYKNQTNLCSICTPDKKCLDCSLRYHNNNV